jgi:hypothetical protein
MNPTKPANKRENGATKIAPTVRTASALDVEKVDAK